jgi:hypothetical protein
MSSLLSVVRRHPIIAFFVLSYTISWAFLPVEAFAVPLSPARAGSRRFDATTRRGGIGGNGRRPFAHRRKATGTMPPGTAAFRDVEDGWPSPAR